VNSTVTVGIPVYHGEEFLKETVDSLLAQTYSAWRVVFSIDGPDLASEDVCRQYLADPRFSLTIQPERLGWVRNISWLQRQADTEFWCYQQQDDLLHPSYLEMLIEEAHRRPGAAVVYCDIETFGDRNQRFEGESVVGSPLNRQLSLLTDHFAGVAFRGLTRVSALVETGGGLVENDVDNFAAETVWIATMATWGDLVRVPATLYRKRYHANNAHAVWLSWDRSQRVHAWTTHCHDILEVAMRIAESRAECWLLWMTTLNRLTASRATSYLPWADLADEDRAAMIDELLERTRRLARIDLDTLLGASWRVIGRRSHQFIAAGV
jgi:glycosyltransferase involved in cell wall biosynthesis